MTGLVDLVAVGEDPIGQGGVLDSGLEVGAHHRGVSRALLVTRIFDGHPAVGKL
jgi:hypothetical protein